MLECSWPAALNAPAVVDGQVDDARTFFHGLDHLAGDHDGGPLSGPEDGADEDVGYIGHPSQVVLAPHQGDYAPARHLLDPSQPLHVVADDDGGGAGTEHRPAGAPGKEAAPDDHDR